MSDNADNADNAGDAVDRAGTPRPTSRVGRSIWADRRAAIFGMGALGAIIVAVIGIAAGAGSPVASAPRQESVSRGGGSVPVETAAGGSSTPASANTLLDRLLLAFVLICIGALVLTIIVFAIRLFFGRNPGLIRRRVLEPDELEMLLIPLSEGMAVPRLTAVREALDESRVALVEGADIRASIIGAWLRLEDIAVAAGTPHLATDTPTDLVERLLAEQNVRPRLLRVLADLYRRARYSPAELVEADRAETLRSLEDISRDLRDGRAEPRRAPPAASSLEPGRWS